MADDTDQKLDLTARVVIGGIAGFVATMAMTAAMRRLHAKLPAKERYPLTPREIVNSTLKPPRGIAPDLTLAAHFAYGAACGALIAAASPRIGRVGGAAAGAGIWLASYMGWIPALGVLKPATSHPLRRNLVMISAHFAWGWSTAEGIRELGKARATIFAAGPDRDIPLPNPELELTRAPRQTSRSCAMLRSGANGSKAAATCSGHCSRPFAKSS